MTFRHMRTALLAAASAFTFFSAPVFAQDRNDDAAVVYTMSNDTGANAVLVFGRKANGELIAKGTVPTGGRGLGRGLGNQGALALGEGGRWLVVVNPGSDDITVFSADDRQLRAVGRTPSGGKMPVSVSIDDDLVYVLNAGSDSIAGFRMNENGRLDPIVNSVRPLSASGAGAAQIGISRGARSVVVTEKATNKLTVYPLGSDGRPAPAPQTVASPSATPFGFSFAGQRTLLVSEAAGGAPNGSSVSSYRIGQDGKLTLVQASTPTHQTAACWVAVTPWGRFAYTTNTGSGTVSGFSVERTGALALLNPNGVAATTGNGPIDMTTAAEGRLLYTLNSASHSISAFNIGPNGALTAGPVFSGLPNAANGLVAR